MPKWARIAHLDETDYDMLHRATVAFLTVRSGPEVIDLVSCSTQLSMKFNLLIKTEMRKNKDFFLLSNSQMLYL